MHTNILTEFHDQLSQLLTARPGGDLDWYHARATSVLEVLHAMPEPELQFLLRSSHSRGIAILRGIPTASAQLALEKEEDRWLELGLRGLQIVALVNDPLEIDSQIHALEASASQLGTPLRQLWKPSDLPGKEYLTSRFDPIATLCAKG